MAVIEVPLNCGNILVSAFVEKDTWCDVSRIDSGTVCLTLEFSKFRGCGPSITFYFKPEEWDLGQFLTHVSTLYNELLTEAKEDLA